MAKRGTKNDVPAVDTAKLVGLFSTLVEFEASEEAPVTVQEMSDEIGENAFDLLGILADAELVEFERGNVWIIVPDISAENAVNIARNALDGVVPTVKAEPKKLTAKEQDYADRTAYAARVAESQDMDLSQAPEFTGKPAEVSYDDLDSEITPAEIPVIAADGTKVTVPVDPETDPKGPRRELDAAKGEKLIAEETITVKVAPKPLPEIKGLDQFIDAETGDMVYESSILKNGLALDEPESVEPCPKGVNPNIWDLAHTAITQSARDYWMRQVNAVLHNQSADAPF
jgi:hypothetical protein